MWIVIKINVMLFSVLLVYILVISNSVISIRERRTKTYSSLSALLQAWWNFGTLSPPSLSSFVV
jgi:hypothetical protein